MENHLSSLVMKPLYIWVLLIWKGKQGPSEERAAGGKLFNTDNCYRFAGVGIQISWADLRKRSLDVGPQCEC